jgi:hypothetical protein
MKNKICNICKKNIKAKDNFCRLTDYKDGKFFKEGFYHTLCYVNQIKHTNPSQVQVRQLITNLAERCDTMMKEAGY